MDIFLNLLCFFKNHYQISVINSIYLNFLIYMDISVISVIG